MSLSLEQVQAVLARVTYRPGWTFAARHGRVEGNPDLTGGLHLTIRGMVEDAFDPGHTTVLDVQVPLPPLADEAQLLALLQWRLLRVETHESREWLRVDHRIYDSPHKRDADRDL